MGIGRMGNDESREEVPMTAALLEEPEVRMIHGRPWTWTDLQGIPEDTGHRYEIIDGSLHVSARPTPRHQRASMRLSRSLEEAAGDGWEVFSEVDVDLGASVLVPDLLVVPMSAVDDRQPKLDGKDVLLAVEIVSPSSRRMDRLVKPSILAEAGVPAYWRVELDGPDTPMLVAYGLDGDVYGEVAVVRAGQSAVLHAPFPVEVRPAELVGPRRRS
jgi:Uma2 family endonuclease